MRTLLLIAFSLAVASASAASLNSERIVGGSVTTITQYPFAVALLYSRTGSGAFYQSCGGSILNSRSFLTTAYCLYGDIANRFRARVGSSYANSGGTVHIVSRIISHPSFNVYNADNDVAIVQVSSVFSFNNNVRAGQIAGSNYYIADSQVVWSIGFGATAFGGAGSNQLRHVQIWTVNQAVCRNRHAELGRFITDNMLCAGWLDVGGRDHCDGDSGGPILHNNIIVGIASWRERCALPRYPGVNTRVSRYTSWIQANA